MGIKVRDWPEPKRRTNMRFYKRQVNREVKKLQAEIDEIRSARAAREKAIDLS